MAEPLPAPAAVAVAEHVAPIIPSESAVPTWPCTGCGEQVPLEEMNCTRCGTAFMGGVSPSVSLHVPGVGDLGSMSPGGRFGVMAGGAAIVMAVFVLLALILGHLF